MIKKIGLDPSIPAERKQAVDLLNRKGLLDEKTGSAWPQLCLMAKSLSTAEYAACLAKDPARPRPQKRSLRDSQHPENYSEAYDYLQ
mmetsp:Transcript_23308/g.31170  ORF Transcript_23308/g.31170 Transcript_23308/m.31170 type:complete len:87 (-) Transcript_23308:55-315(-)